MQEFFASWGEPARYVVSDCDIDLSVASPHALDVYDELLDSFRRVACVGPMLRIHDIPRHYPLYNRVMNRHVEQFWQMVPNRTETSKGPVAFIETAIDTTFALHRAGEPFQRLKSALRVYEPYEARHLDWYQDSIGGDVYSISSNPDISHWNNIAEHETHKDAELQQDSYYIVEIIEGDLKVCLRKIGR